MRIFIALTVFVLTISVANAMLYEVGSGKEFETLSEVPFESLAAGDTVLIYPGIYKEKLLINAVGTADSPIVIKGVEGGELPVLDGSGAVTRQALDFWSEVRGIIKVGGSSFPDNEMPAHIIIEGLEIRNGKPPYSFSDDKGNTQYYEENTAGVFVEKGNNITIRRCWLHDNANGIFVADASTDVLIELNNISSNGLDGKYLQHNTYTSAMGIIYQFNYMGKLTTGSDGNNLKDRSAGCVIRYNFIEDGNRQLDLVDASGEHLLTSPEYRKTYVYGNVLLEHDGEGNSQIIHYGGDSNDPNRYRKGMLYLYHNTVVSMRSSLTTLMRLSSEDEQCFAFNNIIYNNAGGEKLGILNGDGSITLQRNFINAGWKESHAADYGTVSATETLNEEEDPGFVNLDAKNFALLPKCYVAGKGMELPAELSSMAPEYNAIPGQSAYLDYTPERRTEEFYPDLGAYHDGIIDGISEIDKTSVVVFPNPFSDYLILHFLQSGAVVKLYNHESEVFAEKAVSSSMIISASNFADGFYFLQIIYPNRTEKMKLIKIGN